MVPTVVLLCGLTFAALPGDAAGATDALSATLRKQLVKAVPPVLYEARPGWGAQKQTIRGIKNSGTWRDIRVTAPNLDDSLVLQVRDIRQLEPGRTAFTVFLAFDTRLDFTQQNWKAGLKLYDGSLRARCRILLTLGCELTSRLESDKLLPEAVIRVHVTRADVKYEKLVVEHIAGVGGDLARLLGRAIVEGMRQWHPSLERTLLAKADAALVKAGDTGEMRVGLQTLLNPNQPFAIRPRQEKTTESSANSR